MNDLGLVVLRTPVPRTPETLPTDAARAPTSGQSVRLVGYGPTSAADGVHFVRNSGVTTVREPLSPFETVVGGPGEPQDCVGDSGGPMFAVAANGDRVLWGVASRARDDSDASCQSGTVQTRVEAYLPWIRATLAAVSHPAPK